MDELLTSGFSRAEVRLSEGDPTGQTDFTTDTSSPAGRSGDDGSITSSIKHFFLDIFGSDNSEHVQRYSGAVTRGHHVLTVTAANEPEVERAADIVERYGPVDIDEKAAQWAGGAAMASPESARMGSSAMQGAQSMSQQASLSTSEPTKLFGQQSLQDANPQGTTYQESMGSQSDTTLGAGSAMGAQGGAAQGSQQRDLSATESAAIPVVQEDLKVGKREVQRGGVRVFSRVVETPVSESIGLREETVNVERRPVDQPVSTNDATAFKEQSIELRETAEEAVVQKSARVVEEVVVGKQVSERQEQISDTVRHTEVEVEQLRVDNLPDMAADDYYRQHWNSNFASAGGRYEDYAPAYTYGSAIARDDKYRGRKWDEIESDVKSDWESRNPGASTWEKIKAAVRHGWERISASADDDSAYRSHWSTNYASNGSSYDDMVPAYTYGNEMARNDKYRGRKWDDVESDMKNDWDARHPGASTWDRMKAAVRHGWERMTS
jgi:uncharacterized protein (TIGR02271 family)